MAAEGYRAGCLDAEGPRGALPDCSWLRRVLWLAAEGWNDAVASCGGAEGIVAGYGGSEGAVAGYGGSEGAVAGCGGAEDTVACCGGTGCLA